MRNYVLVIAHPDDESMFFLPTLCYLIRSSAPHDRFHLISLSNGNYDGLGQIRELELKRASSIISDKITVHVIVHPRLQDGPRESWDPKIISEVLTTKFKSLEGDAILITFDDRGVSHHRNHIDTCEGVMTFFDDERVNGISRELWLLETISNPLRKYVFVFEVFYLLLERLMMSMGITVSENAHDEEKLFFMFQPFFTWRVMKSHQSQFVWYRRLFVLFSCYSYWNNVKIYNSRRTSFKKNL